MDVIWSKDSGRTDVVVFCIDGFTLYPTNALSPEEAREMVEAILRKCDELEGERRTDVGLVPRTEKVPTFAKRFIYCPRCKKNEFEVEHILTSRIGKAGPWNCGECDLDLWLETKEGELYVSMTRPRFSDGFAIVRIEPSASPVLLKVRTRWHNDSSTECTQEEVQQYLVEEHQCPVKYLRNVEDVWLGSKNDPHGLLGFEAVFRTEEEADRYMSERPVDDGESNMRSAID